MAFPTNPTDGQQYTLGNRTFAFNNTLGVWRVYAAPSTRSVVQTGGAAVISSADDLATDSVANGTFSFDSNNKVLYVFDGNEWVDPVTKTAISVGGGGGAAPFNISLTATYSNDTGNELDVGGGIRMIAMSPDGTKLYHFSVYGYNQYTLGTAWDLTSAVQDSGTISWAHGNVNVHAITFNEDGSKVFVFDEGAGGGGGFPEAYGGVMFEYNLATPYDLRNTSMSVNNDIGQVTIGSTGAGCKLQWVDNGNRLFFGGTDGKTFSATVTTPYTLQGFSRGTVYDVGPACYGMIMSPDGTKLYQFGGYNNKTQIKQYILTTPYDVTTVDTNNILGGNGLLTGAEYGAEYYWTDGEKMIILTGDQTYSASGSVLQVINITA